MFITNKHTILREERRPTRKHTHNNIQIQLIWAVCVSVVRFVSWRNDNLGARYSDLVRLDEEGE